MKRSMLCMPVLHGGARDNWGKRVKWNVMMSCDIAPGGHIKQKLEGGTNMAATYLTAVLVLLRKSFIKYTSHYTLM